MAQAINQHKALAMGLKPAFKSGGSVPKYGKEGSKSEERHDKTEVKKAMGGSIPFLKSGKKDSPLEMAKRSNGIPGFKKGGKC